MCTVGTVNITVVAKFRHDLLQISEYHLRGGTARTKFRLDENNPINYLLIE